MKTWFITGGSTGLGRCIAEAAFERGDKVAVVDIAADKLNDYTERFGNRAYTQAVDVTNEEMVEDAFANTIKALGPIDVVVNNAGFMHLGTVEELKTAELRQVMQVNFMGNFFVARAAAKHMREKKSGMIIQMASLAAVDVRQGNGAYGASKWAVEGMSEALANEMAPFGVKVVMIEPGTIKTGIERRCRHSEPIEAYKEIMAEDSQRWIAGDDSGSTGDPVKCAKVIMLVSEMADPPLRMPLTTLSLEVSKMKMQSRLEELEKWKDVIVMANFDE